MQCKEIENVKMLFVKWLIVWTIAEQLRILIVLQIKIGENFYQVIKYH